MGRVLIKFGFMVLLALLSSCLTTHVNLSLEPGEKVYEQSETFFLFGLIGKKVKLASELCPGSKQITQLETTTSAMDALYTALTFTIYSPKTLSVWCAEPRS